MKKTILIFAAVSMTLVSVGAQTKSKSKDKKVDVPVPVVPVKILTNDVDSMSYSFGINIGADLSKSLKAIPGGKINIDLLVKGFSASIKGDSTLLKPELATEFFRTYITNAQNKEVVIAKAKNEKYLTDNKTQAGVISTASGLQYKIMSEKAGVKPVATDTVTVNYIGTLIDGTKFDNSIERGEPATFPLNQVIPGWTEGVQLMTVGSRYKFFIPYSLGYGEKGAGNGAIPAYATLIFEVELLNVKHFKEPVPVIEAKPVVKAKTIKKATPATTAKKKAVTKK